MDPKHLNGGVSQGEETPKDVNAESKTMDERLEALVDDLYEDDPGPSPEPSSQSEPEDGEPKPEATPEKQPEASPPHAEVFEAPSFLNEEERAAFQGLPDEAKKALVRMGKAGQQHFTQTSQEIARERNRLAAMEGLFNQMQADPGYAQHVLKGYQHPQEPEGPPEDPVEAFEWEVRQKIMRELAPRFEEQNQRMEAFNHQAVIAQAKQQFQADPQYQDVQEAILKHVSGLPESVGRPLFNQLDNDPRAYGEMFAHFKAQLAQRSVVPVERVDKAIPAPVKTQQRAPLLEGAGPVAESQEVQKRKKLKQTKAEALASGSVQEIGDYLEQAGFLDDLA